MWKPSLTAIVPVVAIVAACGGVTPGDDHVLCECLFGPFAYTIDVCTVSDEPPDSPAYGGSRVHGACVHKCGELLGPLYWFGASDRHVVLGDGVCRAGTSAVTDPLLGADGPDTTNYVFIPSMSRAVLRRSGAFGFLDLSSVALGIDAPRGISDGVAGVPVAIKKIMLEGDFPVLFDGHSIHRLLVSLANGFIYSSTNGEHSDVYQVNGITIPPGQTMLFSGEIDGAMRYLTTTTTTPHSIEVLRYGSPGAYVHRLRYTATIAIPNTPYEVFLDLYFDEPPAPIPVISAVITTYLSPKVTRVTPRVIGADRFQWFHPFTGQLLSTKQSPTFDIGQLGADCVVFWAEDSKNKSGQDEFVCLSSSGCSKACQDASQRRP